jgi:hypothetical protein
LIVQTKKRVVEGRGSSCAQKQLNGVPLASTNAPSRIILRRCLWEQAWTVPRTSQPATKLLHLGWTSGAISNLKSLTRYRRRLLLVMPIDPRLPILDRRW